MDVMGIFKLHSPFKPSGDQITAIEELSQARPGKSTLVGVTGSGKTFTIANIIANQDKKVLVLAPNKTLAAQLYEEFSQFFPENKVCYFVSYYDYYQPESYVPSRDLYIAKETKVNAELERLRVEATASIINRKDTIVISSVSCIYSLGNPKDYRELAFPLVVGQELSKDDLINKLTFIQYRKNNIDRLPGTFQAFGNTIDISLPYQKEVLRVSFSNNFIVELSWIDRVTEVTLMKLDNALIFPARHFVTTDDKKESAIKNIEAELDAQLRVIQNPVYKERLREKVYYDMQMLEETGYCNGIENYSSYFDGRMPGDKPFCLLDFFNNDFLLIIDESHVAVPQLRGMYAGDRSRKKTLIDYGFRLPSALDNRPLKFEETEKFFSDVIFVSATPGNYELVESSLIVEQVIRPTGLTDPIVEVRDRNDQMTNLIEEINKTKEKGFRSLVTVLTKKLAEELAYYLQEHQIKVCYLHSNIKTPERTEILHKLRLGIFDCVVGVNLLREGLDLPEVALVAIMDADIEGFLRDKRSLIQTIGRAARNTESKVVLYADRITDSMKNAIDETNRRRAIQIKFNDLNNIEPKTVRRDVTKSISNMQAAVLYASKTNINKIDQDKLAKKIQDVEQMMTDAAEKFDFQLAIELREELNLLKKKIKRPREITGS